MLSLDGQTAIVTGGSSEIGRACMAMDLAPDIRVNTVNPGWIWTREVDKAADYDREKWGSVCGKFHLLRRLGKVEELAAAAAFF